MGSSSQLARESAQVGTKTIVKNGLLCERCEPITMEIFVMMGIGVRGARRRSVAMNNIGGVTAKTLQMPTQIRVGHVRHVGTHIMKACTMLDGYMCKHFMARTNVESNAMSVGIGMKMVAQG